MAIEQALEQHLQQADDHEAELYAEFCRTQIQMMGCTSEQLEKGKPDYQDDVGEAFSWLSDAQEMLARNQNEEARRFINRAKYYLGKLPQEHRSNNQLW